MKKTIQCPDTEPTEQQSKFELPSESEHLFQIVDVYDYTTETGAKMKLDNNTVMVKIEIADGDELGRTMLNRCSLDVMDVGFFATRLLLKAIGFDHKGEITIDTDQWIGLQFFATVKHSKSRDGLKTYANIDKYNFDKLIDQAPQGGAVVSWDD